MTAYRERNYARRMDYSQRITSEPGKRSGQPCIRGTRITVRDVLEYLAGGMSVEEVLADFPELAAEDIRACLAFAADREQRVARECAKLDAHEEQALADEGLAEDLEQWPEY